MSIMIYFEEASAGSDWPRAAIHNPETGVTYVLEVLPNYEPDTRPMPLVMIVPAESLNGLGRRLCQGAAAINFWEGLLRKGYDPGALMARLKVDSPDGGKPVFDVEEEMPF